MKRILTNDAIVAISVVKMEMGLYNLNNPDKNLEHFTIIIGIIKNLKGFSFKELSKKVGCFGATIPVNDSSKVIVNRLAASFKAMHTSRKIIRG